MSSRDERRIASGTMVRIPYVAQSDFALGDVEPAEVQIDLADDHTLSFVALIRGFSPDECDVIQSLRSRPDFAATLINDRHAKLQYRHRAYRVETLLKHFQPAIYAKLMNIMRAVDSKMWDRIPRYSAVFPEIEYIVYEKLAGGDSPFIEPHVDNDSVITLLTLLCDPEDFVGGLNMFEPAAKGGGKRSHQLARGDVIVFRGEKLEHWITPITAGKRELLQVELSKYYCEADH